MRSRSILLTAVVIGLVAPAFGQTDPNKEIEQLASRFAEYYNKQHAAGIAILFAKDGVLVSPGPTVVKTGSQALEQAYAAAFKAGMNHNDITVDQVSPFGSDAVIALGEYHATGQ